MKTIKKAFKEELIGRKIKVIDAKNRTLVGIQGIVIDDTKFTLLIDTPHGVKRVIKAQCVFELDLDGLKIKAEGRELIGTPDERLAS